MDQERGFIWITELYRMGQAPAVRKNPNHIHGLILRHMMDGFEADGGILAWKTRDAPALSVAAAVGPVPATAGDAIPLGEGMLGWAAGQSQPVLITGDSDSRFADQPASPQQSRPISTICLPLKTEQDVACGALALYRFDGREPFVESDLQQGAMLASMILVVAENVKLQVALQQQIQKLEQLNMTKQEAQRRIEEEHAKLLENDERLNSILASLDDVVWSILPDTFETIYMNPAAAKVYGRPAEDFYGDSDLWLQIVYEDDRQRVLNGLGMLYERGVCNFDYRITMPNGEARWVHDHVCVIYGEGGKPVRLDGITVDITQHKLAEEKLHKSHEELKEAYRRLQEVQGQLLQSEKMASIGQLAAGVAHEINNPIGYVYSNLGSLQKYVQDIFTVVDAYEKLEALVPQNHEAYAALRAVKQKADLEFLKEDVSALMSESYEGITRVKKIVQDLKDFSHAGAEDDWQWSDLHHGIDSTLNIVWNELKYKAEVKKEYGDIPDIECLPPQLNQVFMNLLVNAAHAIEDRGTITIRTGMEGENSVWVEVSDTGKGINPDNLGRIFDPFFTTKPVGQGTGLGLSVSYSIIQKHHGSISVDSTVGAGTTFRIVLPVKQPENSKSE